MPTPACPHACPVCTYDGEWTTFFAAHAWGVDESQVRRYCEAGRVPGAYRAGHVWLIPRGTAKPQRAR